MSARSTLEGDADATSSSDASVAGYQGQRQGPGRRGHQAEV